MLIFKNISETLVFNRAKQCKDLLVFWRFFIDRTNIELTTTSDCDKGIGFLLNSSLVKILIPSKLRVSVSCLTEA